jgi:hypothetical protein
MVDSYNKGKYYSSEEEIYDSYEGVGGLVGAAWQTPILRSYNEVIFHVWRGVVCRWFSWGWWIGRYTTEL